MRTIIVLIIFLLAGCSRVFYSPSIKEGVEFVENCNGKVLRIDSTDNGSSKIYLIYYRPMRP